jgi:hypothetical protein
MRDGLILHERPAGRLARNVVLTGKVLLNGKKRRLDYGVVVSILSPCPCAIQSLSLSIMPFFHTQLPNFQLSHHVTPKGNP